jgi:hypothetical protein
MSKSEQTITNRGAAASQLRSIQKVLDIEHRFIDDLMGRKLPSWLRQSQTASVLMVRLTCRGDDKNHRERRVFIPLLPVQDSDCITPLGSEKQRVE